MVYYNKNPKRRLFLDIGNPEKQDGDEYRVSALASLSEGNKPVDQATIVFYLDGKKFDEEPVDENGNCSIEIPDLKTGSKPRLRAQEKGGVAQQTKKISVPQKKEEKEKLQKITDEDMAKIQATFNAMGELVTNLQGVTRTIEGWLKSLSHNSKLDTIKTLVKMGEVEAAKKLVYLAHLRTDEERTQHAYDTGLIKPIDEAALGAYNDLLQELEKTASGKAEAKKIDAWIMSLEEDECQIFIKLITGRNKQKAITLLKLLASQEDEIAMTQIARARGLIGLRNTKRS